MFDFALSEEEQLIQETARRFARSRLGEHIRAHEKARGVPSEIQREFTNLGLDGVDLAPVAGGQGLGLFARSLVLEELGAVDAGAALALDRIGPAVYPLIELRLDGVVAELRQQGGRAVVIADSDGRFQMDASKVSGEQPWVAADDVSLAVILQDRRALVVRDGIQLSHISACGLEAAGASKLVLAEAPVVTMSEDPASLEHARAKIRVYTAALLTGAARGAHEYSMRYATERTAFGRPIAHHQALAFLIADMAIAVATARLAVWRAAVAIDRGDSGEWEAAAALAETAEQALFVGPNAVQLLGGHGFMKDHPVEKWMRDIRTLAQLGGGRDGAELAAAESVLGVDTSLV